MTITVKVGEAKTHLSDLLRRVERGEEVIIARGDRPIAKLSPVRSDVSKVIENMIAAQKGRPKTTVEEILAWRDEGKKYL